MAQHTYRNEKDMKNLAEADRLVSEMPYFAKTFFTNLKNRDKASGTILGYARDLHVFFSYLQGSAGFKGQDIRKCSVDMLELLTIDDLEEFIASIGYSANGRARMMSALRSFYKYYRITRKDIRKDPAALLDPPKIREKEIITLAREEVGMILDAVLTPDKAGKPLTKRREKTKSRDFAILMVLLGTGVRVSELVGLDLQDVDMKTGCLHIVRKGGNEDRVYFGDEVKEAIEAYWADDRDALEPGEDAKEALFISYEHHRLSVRSVETLVKRYSQKAGLGKKITPHKMRSTFGTHLYEETGDIYLVASALGHSSVETTQKRYAKQQEKNKVRAAAVSSTLFSSKDE